VPINEAGLIVARLEIDSSPPVAQEFQLQVRFLGDKREPAAG
jgi:hypothetical protein